jgi:hypothetical protein
MKIVSALLLKDDPDCNLGLPEDSSARRPDPKLNPQNSELERRLSVWEDGPAVPKKEPHRKNSKNIRVSLFGLWKAAE